MPTVEATSTLTQRYQTTVPKPVREALKLGKDDTIRYRVEGDRVWLERAKPEDPAMAAFLEFLGRDLEAHPERIAALPADLRDRIAALTEGVEVDLDAALPDDA